MALSSESFGWPVQTCLQYTSPSPPPLVPEWARNGEKEASGPIGGKQKHENRRKKLSHTSVTQKKPTLHTQKRE